MPKGIKVPVTKSSEFELPDGMAIMCRVAGNEDFFILCLNNDVYTITGGNVLKYELSDQHAAKSYAQGIRSKRAKVPGDNASHWRMCHLSQTKKLAVGDLWSMMPSLPSDANIHTLLASDSADDLFSALGGGGGGGPYGQDAPATAPSDDYSSSRSSNHADLTPHMDPARYMDQLMGG